MPVILAKNHDDTTGGERLEPEALIQLIKGKAIKGGDYNNDGGRVSWFTINLTDGTWLTIHHLGEGAACIYTTPPGR
jgi:hypothetical protein